MEFVLFDLLEVGCEVLSRCWGYGRKGWVCILINLFEEFFFDGRGREWVVMSYVGGGFYYLLRWVFMYVEVFLLGVL